MDNTDVTNPEPVEELEVTTEEPIETEEPDDTESEAEEPSTEDNPAELTAEEWLEIELAGKQLKLPKEVEPLLMFQKDYTQKTQAVAEERRLIETEREALQQERAIVAEVGRNIHELDQIEERLQYLRTQVDPRELPPPLLMQYTAEKAELENKFSQLNQRTSERVAELQEQQAKIEAQRNEANWRKVTTPNPTVFWDGKFDQARSQELTKFAAETLGIKPEQQRQYGPEMVYALNLAKVGLETLRKQTAALAKPKVEAKPVPEVTGKKSASPMTAKDADKLPTDKWLEWRNKQVARKRG